MARIRNYIKIILIRIYYCFRPCISFFMYLIPIKKNKMVLDNFMGKGYGDNPKYICDELLKGQASNKWDIVWLVAYPDYSFPEGIRTVKYDSIQSLYEFASAKFWIDNVRNTYKPRKKRGQIYLQTWHGSYSPKLLENSAKETLSHKYLLESNRDGKITDAILVNSSMLEEQYKESFVLNKNVQFLRYGLPRCDYLVNNNGKNELYDEIKTKLGLATSEIFVLYAPTFRDDNSDEGYKIDFENVRKAFGALCDADITILLRFHPNVKMNFNDENLERKNIVDVSSAPDMQELLLISSFLITDYSTSIFDFALLNRPVFLCALDIEQYNKTRGLSENYFELPFPLARTNYELVEFIKRFNYEEYEKKIYNYFKVHKLYDLGKASKLVTEWMQTYN